MFEIIQSNETVPLVLADGAGNIMAHRNIDSVNALDTAYLNALVVEMREEKTPIRIDLGNGQHNLIYYQDSYLLTQLIYFPYIQFSIILLFMMVGYFAFSSSRRAEQNRVWVGMAKETAHQLGTPLNSLTGWVEYLRDHLQPQVADRVLPEMEKDIDRLVTVTDRFSKIGSTPSLARHSMLDIVKRSVDYLRTRASGKMKWDVKHGNEEYMAMANPALFEWVLENLLKNALDAMTGAGSIAVTLSQDEQHVVIDVKDSGKGIPPNRFAKVFKPGFSTKQRGWGLGLSLSKRIVEEYHGGKIFVKESQPGKGTTFRILMPKG
jgi:signal transduction histidine kinase